MTIILILIGLLFAGIRQWTNSAATAATKARFETLNSMLADFSTAGQNQYLTQWFIPQSANVALALNADSFGNVTSAAEGSSQTFSIAGSPTPSYVANSRVQALSYMTFGVGVPQTPGDPLTQWLNPEPATAAPSLAIQPYYGIMTKLAGMPNTAKSMAGIPSNAQQTVSASSVSYPALFANTAPPPVILDGWGNPILFCPGSELILNPTSTPCGGLAGVYLNVNGNNAASDVTVVSPDGKPFWVSAGPDGDFSRGDDNLYSFNPQ